MCGITGWIDWEEDLKQKRNIVASMTESLSARGPDASGIWLSNRAAFGHRRLCVVDPEGGAQPMIRKLGEKTYVITYNGELYNTPDLRERLEARGYTFSTHCDTEVLLVSYIEWGTECIKYFNGIYAFGIWDDSEQKLFMARDRMGVKPLFYALHGRSFLFGSELKALLAHPAIKPEVGMEGLAEVFALGPSRTPGHGVFKGISEVRPGFCLVFDRNGLRMHRYWALESVPHTYGLEATISTVRQLVEDSIERQLVSDVPVCTFLSGGLDSSAISVFSAKGFKKLGWGQLHTYSIDYVDNDRFFKPSEFQPNPDSQWIPIVSEFLSSCHHNMVFDTTELVDALTSALYARDLPGMADIDSSLYLFCREVKKEATVALSGECADEIFGGYPWFLKPDLLNSNTFPWLRSMEERSRILSREIVDMVRPEEYVAQRYKETLDEVPRLPGEVPLEARRREMFYLNLTWFMTTLLDRKDRMSMASGLEVRVPFCDHRIVEYVWNIPWEIKMYGGREKGILRRALEGVLPDEILYRKKSPYPKTHNPAYEAAVRGWLMEILNDPGSPLLPLIDKKAILELAAGQSDYGRPWFGQLMATPQMFAYLIQVDMWLRKYRISII